MKRNVLCICFKFIQKKFGIRSCSDRRGNESRQKKVNKGEEASWHAWSHANFRVIGPHGAMQISD